MVTASIFGLGAILDPGNAELLVLSGECSKTRIKALMSVKASILVLLVLSGECSKTRIEALTDIRAFDVFNFSFMK